MGKIDKKQPVGVLSLLLVLPFLLSGCKIAGAIFKAGTWFGILSVVIVIVIILLIIRALSKK